MASYHCDYYTVIGVKMHLLPELWNTCSDFLCFPLQGPVNYICLHCVKPSMRPLAMAMSTVSIHLFGDVPSSPLVGVLEVSLPIFVIMHITYYYDSILYSIQTWPEVITKPKRHQLYFLSFCLIAKYT